MRVTASRRQFLCGAAAATALPLCSRPLPGAGPDWTMKLSCSSINFNSLPFEQACGRISALGFEAIDIWGPIFGCKHLDQAVELGPGRTRDLLAQHRLKLCAVSVYGGGYAKYAKFLGECGGGVAIRGSTKPVPPADITGRMKNFLEELKPELELCEKHDGYLAIENHGKALLDSLDSFKAFVDQNRHPRLGIALAPYHLQAIGASVEQAIRIAGRQLLFFYAWQNAPETQQLPGIGPADCRPWIKALAEIGYGRYVNPFMHHEPDPDAMSAAMAKSRQYMLECGK